MTKALTLHQPWASLVACGAKSIETRSWAPPEHQLAAGDRLLIHAGMSRPWTPSQDDGERAARMMRVVPRSLSDGMRGAGIEYPLLWSARAPLGAIVASCTLVDCVPMVGQCPPSMEEPPHLCLAGYALLHRPESDPFPDGETERDVSDQLPFGDFTPGRYAWLLEDVQPTTERCPACWGEGLRPRIGGQECEFCRAGSDGGCSPVPARGAQRLWEWTP